MRWTADTTGCNHVVRVRSEAVGPREGRGHLPEIKFLNRTLRWHEEEASFSWSGGTWCVGELAGLLGHTSNRAVTKTESPGTKATGSGARDALEPLDTFQATVGPRWA